MRYQIHLVIQADGRQTIGAKGLCSTNHEQRVATHKVILGMKLIIGSK